MANEKDACSLPDGPGDLCFNKNDFIKNSFSVDEFLQNHRKNANLETMRDDLGKYSEVLRSSMIELINKDYADFVNLSSNLIGLDKAINKIQVPLGQLKEEVWQVQTNLDEAISELTSCLENQRSLRQSKQTLHSLSYVQQSIQNLSTLLILPPVKLTPTESKNSGKADHNVEPLGADLVERIASELNQLNFRLNQCGYLMAPVYQERLAVIESTLTKSLDNLFLTSIHESELNTMKRCLRVYESLGKSKGAEELFQKRVVAQVLHPVISETSLQSNPEGLKGVYREILEFVDSRMKDLLEFTSCRERSPVVSGFQFLVNSFWPEVEKRLELHMSSIFAPGNPDNFFQNYSETQNFLRELEQRCGSQAHVKQLHEHPQYLAFLHLWNLPVYFQIRFQEIAGSVEKAFQNWVLNIKADNSRFQLTTTNALWKALQICWNPNIFLPQITHRFWKLTLQIIARYYVWTGEAISERWPEVGAPRTEQIGRLPFLVCLFCDIKALAASTPEIMEMASLGLGKVTLSSQELCKDSLRESVDQLVSRLPAVTEQIVSEVSAASGSSLRQVSDIPRLFRRTNREMPTKPCPYMSAVIAPLINFHNANKNNVSAENLQEWLTLISSSITCQLFVCVSDVLTSVQKTEESLRRLKKMRERGAQPSAAEGRGLTDDDKIRMQLVIDVDNFCQEIVKLGVKRDNVERLNDLVTLVENASQAQLPTQHQVAHVKGIDKEVLKPEEDLES